MNYNLADFSLEKRVQLLKALWSASAPAMFFSNHPWVTAPAFDDLEAASHLSRCPYVDYFCGRPIKVDFASNAASSDLYDRDAGDGTFHRVFINLVY